MTSIRPNPLTGVVLAVATALPTARAEQAAGLEAAPASRQAPGAVQELLHGIRGMQRLPVAGVQMVDVGERVLFVSDNGRYVFTGPAWDLWHGAKLQTLEEGARLAARVDLKRLGLDPASLGAIDLGSGKEDVVAFVDPRCPHCRSLLEKLPGLKERYRFRLVLVPVLGRDSETAVVRLDCLAKGNPDAAREALLEGTVAALPDATGTCGQALAQRALVSARLLGIRGGPYLIAPDGRLRQGVPDDLTAWLEGNE
jgi:thiol:disulfide interchange protein DsbC